MRLVPASIYLLNIVLYDTNGKIIHRLFISQKQKVVNLEILEL